MQIAKFAITTSVGRVIAIFIQTVVDYKYRIYVCCIELLYVAMR